MWIWNFLKKSFRFNIFPTIKVYTENMKFVLWVYLIVLGYRDWKDQYISLWWIPPSLVVFSLYPPTIDWEHVCGAFLFGLPGAYMYHFKEHWIGSADVCFLFFFGLILGYQRMIIAMLVALPLGIFWSFRKRDVPFITCLCVGIWIAHRMGYKIWYHFML